MLLMSVRELYFIARYPYIHFEASLERFDFIIISYTYRQWQLPPKVSVCVIESVYGMLEIQRKPTNRSTFSASCLVLVNNFQLNISFFDTIHESFFSFWIFVWNHQLKFSFEQMKKKR